MKLQYKLTKSGCKECTSHKRDRFGYPRCNFKGKNTTIHRRVWIELFGDIPEGLVVRHRCDNPACINSEHLELGTIRDNIKDRVLRGRTSRAPRTNGTINGMSKLTPSIVHKIRSLRGKATQAEIAKQFGISQSHVAGIHTRRYWKHLEDSD